LREANIFPRDAIVLNCICPLPPPLLLHSLPFVLSLTSISLSFSPSLYEFLDCDRGFSEIFTVAVFFLIEKRVIYNFPRVPRENMRGDTTEITSSEASLRILDEILTNVLFPVVASRRVASRRV